MNEADALRAEMRHLLARFATGDLSRNRLERVLTEKTVALCRTVVTERLGKKESIRAEHHWAHAHLSRSILQEPEQMAVSLFASDARLFYVQLRLMFGRPVTCDGEDGTTIEEVPYHRITGLRLHRNTRPSEIVAGALILSFAVVFHAWLRITGTLMQVLGIIGILHGALVPTRWVEIELAGGPSHQAPLTVHAVRKKSARVLLDFLRSRIDSCLAFR